MSVVPQVPLGQVCTINPRTSRKDLPSDETLVSFIPMAAVDEVTGTIIKRSTKKLGEVRTGYTAFSEGDVLFAKITPCMENGKLAVATDLENGMGRGSTEFHVLRPGERIIADYIYHFVRRKQFREEAKRNFTGTAGQQRVPKTFMENALVPLPSMAEQRWIADILNRTARIERLRRQAVAHLRALTPALFLELFGDPVENPMRWPMVPLAEIASVNAGDPAPQNPEAFSDDGPIFVRMQDVGRDHINSELDRTTDRLNRTWLRENRLRLFPQGSLLIPKSGASVNLNHRAMLAADAYVVSHLAVVTPKVEVVDPDFLFWWSVNYDPRAQVQVTSLPSLKVSTLKEVLVPLPPLDRQAAFGRLAAAITVQQGLAEQATALAVALSHSLLDRLIAPQTPALRPKLRASLDCKPAPLGDAMPEANCRANLS